MHEGIDALIDRIACRVIERLDERNAAKQQGVEATVQPPATNSPIAADNVQAQNTSDITPHATNEDGACETSCTLTERAMQMVDEMYDTRYNVLDRVAEIRHHNDADAPFVPVSKLVRNTIVIDMHKRGCMVWNNDVDRMGRARPRDALGHACEPRCTMVYRVPPLVARHGGGLVWCRTGYCLRLTSQHRGQCHRGQCHDSAACERGARLAQEHFLPYVAAR